MVHLPLTLGYYPWNSFPGGRRHGHCPSEWCLIVSDCSRVGWNWVPWHCSLEWSYYSSP